jgi:hypothetical protein
MALRICIGALALVAVLVVQALAQPNPSAPAPAPAAAPPVSFGADWVYEMRPPDIHSFQCVQPRCTPPAVISYRIYPPDVTMTLRQFRDEQAHLIKMLQDRGPPGTRIRLLDVSDKGSGPLRIYVARRLTEFPNGAREFRVSGMVLGKTRSATTISTSSDEKVSIDNHGTLAAGVMAFFNQRQ